MLRLREQGSKLKGRIIGTGRGTQRRESGGSASAVSVDWRIQKYRGFIAFLQLMVFIACVLLFMRNKTEQFRKKYAPDSFKTVQNSPLKTIDPSSYRSTCNLTRFPSRPRLPLRSERQLQAHQSTPTPLYGSTGSRKVLTRQQSGPNMMLKKQVSLKIAMNEMHETTNTQVSELKWRPSKESSVLEETGRSFIEKLPKNTLFYCCKCYQYVF